MGQHVRNLAQG